MLGDYAMVLGDKVLSSFSSGPSLEQWCQGKRMVGTEIGDKKSLNFSFTSNYLVPFGCFCRTESIPDLQWENKMVDPLAEKLQKVFGA
eukprot:s12376_g1.t1